MHYMKCAPSRETLTSVYVVIKRNKTRDLDDRTTRGPSTWGSPDVRRFDLNATPEARLWPRSFWSPVERHGAEGALPDAR